MCGSEIVLLTRYSSNWSSRFTGMFYNLKVITATSIVHKIKSTDAELRELFPLDAAESAQITHNIYRN